MSQTHDIKCWPEFFQPLWDGTKTAEMRKNDRNYRVGDILHIREWVLQFGLPEGGYYTGRWVDVEVTHIVWGGEFGIAEGFCMMSVPRVIARSPGENHKCCHDMELYLQNEDDIIHYSRQFQEFSIPIHDGGTSGIVIRFCPWCGAKLPESVRPKGDTP